ncbi:MAG: hypothetical protein LBU57_10320 [Dysgonamonadaceae bacterium]|jgi:hypothetical protein|nr:hypothetical protein [Dysgonamonadaceae bacterium]
MKRISYLVLLFTVFVFFGCSETVNIEIPENYEKANITGITVYNTSGTSISSKVTITDSAQEVVVVLGTSYDLTKLKVSLTVSPGSTVIQPLGTGYLDFSNPRTVTIVSPGGSVKNEWNIQIKNP